MLPQNSPTKKKPARPRKKPALAPAGIAPDSGTEKPRQNFVPVVQEWKEHSTGNVAHVGLYRRIAGGFFILAVLLVGGAFLMTFKSATITVIARPRAVEVSAVATVGATVEDMGMMKGAVLVGQETFVKSYTPETEKELPAQAEGTVTLVNNTDRNQPLVATTRLLSADGILFRLRENTVVPAEGQISARVYADQPGGHGNIGPSRFTIPGLWEGLQKDIYAESSAPMAGGIKKVGIVGQADVDRALADFSTAFKEYAFAKALEQHATYTGVALQLQDIAVTYDEDVVGTEVDSITVQGTATVVAVGYDTQEAALWIDAKAREKYATQDTTIIIPDVPPHVTVESYDATEKTARIVVQRTAAVQVNTESPLLESSLFMGKGMEEIQRIIGGLPGVDAVKVEFFPQWSTIAPGSPDKITVTVTGEPG